MNDCDRNFKPTCPPVGLNVQQPVLFNKTVIDSAQGDEEGSEAPYKGKFRNTLVVYEATDAIYLFSSDGNFTFLGYGFSQITKEEVERLISEAIGEEAQLREDADNALGERIDAVETNLASEVSAREAADTTLQNNIDAETIARTAAEASIVADLTAEKTAREITDTGLQTQIAAVDTAIDTNVMTDLIVDPNTSTTVVQLDTTKKNLKTSVTTTDNVPLPVASATQAGVMNSATYNAIAQNTQDIANIKGEVVAISGLPASPTQNELTTAWLNASGETALINGAGIFDVTNEKRWTYYSNDNTWHFLDAHGSVQVNAFTNTTAGIIKGSTNNGQVFAESDGTGSVQGWDALKAQADNATSKLATVESGAQVNVQSDWTEGDTTSDAYIKNKPAIDTALSNVSSNAVTNAAITTEFEKVAYEGEALSTPTNVAYVANVNIQDGAVETAKLANESVTTAKLADDAVTGDKIASQTVTSDNIDFTTFRYCEAILTVAQTIPPTISQIIYNDFAVNNGFTLNNGYVTVPATGVYRVSAGVFTVASTGYTGMRLLVNGSEVTQHFETFSSTSNTTTGDHLLVLNAGDTIGVSIQSSASASTSTGSYPARRTYLTITQVG